MIAKDFEFQITKHLEKRLKKHKNISIDDIFYKVSKAITLFIERKGSNLMQKIKVPLLIPHLDNTFVSLYVIEFDKNYRIICTFDLTKKDVVVTLFDICNHDDYKRSIDYVASIVMNEIYHGKI